MSTRKTGKKKAAKKTKGKTRRKAKKTLTGKSNVSPAKTYSSDTRIKFQDKIIKLRAGTQRSGPLTYKAVADKMNSLGFVNRDKRPITPQFVGNILNRLKPAKKDELIKMQKGK